MHYAKIKNLDVANGDGIRVSLFVSGCRNHCKGCFNPETWRFDYGEPFDAIVQAEIMLMLDKPYIKGLSILGGDPLEPENEKALIPFVKMVKKVFPNKDIWLWTGYNYEMVKDRELLNYVDILVDGPFRIELKDISLRFRGSKNQRILSLKKTCGTCRNFDGFRCLRWREQQEKWKIKKCWESPNEKH